MRGKRRINAAMNARQSAMCWGPGGYAQDLAVGSAAGSRPIPAVLPGPLGGAVGEHDGPDAGGEHRVVGPGHDGPVEPVDRGPVHLRRRTPFDRAPGHGEPVDAGARARGQLDLLRGAEPGGAIGTRLRRDDEVRAVARRTGKRPIAVVAPSAREAPRRVLEALRRGSGSDRHGVGAASGDQERHPTRDREGGRDQPGDHEAPAPRPHPPVRRVSKVALGPPCAFGPNHASNAMGARFSAAPPGCAARLPRPIISAPGA